MAENSETFFFNEKHCELLLTSIKERDFRAVKTLLNDFKLTPRRFPLSLRDPVCTATEAEDDAIFNLLLESGFDPDRYFSNDAIARLKPIHIAACRGNVQFSRRLIEKYNVSVDSLDDKGKTPLMWAVYRQRIVLVQYLISQGANVNHTDKSGLTPLFLSVGKRNSLGIMKMLIEAGSDVNVKVRSRCLFYKAAVTGRLDMAKLLYQHGIRLGSDCVELWSKRDIKLIKFLIEINAPLDGSADVELAPMYIGSLTAASCDRSHQWLHLLMETGHCISVIDWDKVYGKLVDENFEMMKNKIKCYTSNPNSLQQLCVLTIRKILGVSLPRHIDSLPLPSMLRRRVRQEHLYN